MTTESDRPGLARLRAALLVALPAFFLALPILLAPAGTLPGIVPWGSNDYDAHLIHPAALKAGLALGDWPTWNAYDSLGVRLLVFPTTLLHPLAVALWALLPLRAALVLLVASSVVLSALTFRAFASRLDVGEPAKIVGALVYASSGALAARIAIGHLEFVLAYPLVPLVLLAHDLALERPGRARVAWAAAATVAPLLAGGAYVFAFTGFLLLGLYAVRGRRLFARMGRVAAPSVLAAGAVILVFSPTGAQDVDPLQGSTTTTEVFADLVAPGTEREHWWEGHTYVGAGVVALAAAGVAARRGEWALVFGVGAVACLLWAAGANSPLAFLHRIPFVDALRYPERVVAVLAVPVAGLAAMGFDEASRPDRRWILALLAAVGGLVALDAAWTASRRAFFDDATLVQILVDTPEFNARDMARNAFAATLLALVALAGVLLARRSTRTVAAVAILVLLPPFANSALLHAANAPRALVDDDLPTVLAEMRAFAKPPAVLALSERVPNSWEAPLLASGYRLLNPYYARTGQHPVAFVDLSGTRWATFDLLLAGPEETVPIPLQAGRPPQEAIATVTAADVADESAVESARLLPGGPGPLRVFRPLHPLPEVAVVGDGTLAPLTVLEWTPDVVVAGSSEAIHGLVVARVAYHEQWNARVDGAAVETRDVGGLLGFEADGGTRIRLDFGW